MQATIVKAPDAPVAKGAPLEISPCESPQFAAPGGRVLPSMQLGVLKYFLAVARTGFIRLACEELFVAPSAVSRQMTALEQVQGIPLFERSAKGGTPGRGRRGVCGHCLLDLSQQGAGPSRD